MNPKHFEVVDAADWYGGTTLWLVAYEYADADGGGLATDYFRTASRYTPPTGPAIRCCLDGERLTVIGIDRIESFTTDTPEDQLSADPPPANAFHGRVFDLIADEPSEAPPILFEDF